MLVSESSPRRDRRRFARCRWLSGWLGLLLSGTGCPQLLDDDFGDRDSDLSRPGPTDGRGDGGGSGGSNGGSGAASGGSAGADSAGSSGSGGTGTLAEPRACPFGEPEPVAGLGFSDGAEWGPSLTADGLTLFFAHETSEGADLYRATRPDRGVTFSTPVALTDLNNADADEGTPFVSNDGLRLYFYSNRAGGLGGRDLYVATRSSLAAEFTSALPLANVNSSASDHLPRLSSDELTLWFTSSRAEGVGGADLWMASRTSRDAAFGTPTLFEAVNGSSGEESGNLTEDGLVLVFDSTREGSGNSQIFVATRAGVDQAFPSPTTLDIVNSARNEYNVFLTRDERELFFASNREVGSTHRLFRSLRSCE
jgi:hypothetical protein